MSNRWTFYQWAILYKSVNLHIASVYNKHIRLFLLNNFTQLFVDKAVYIFVNKLLIKFRIIHYCYYFNSSQYCISSVTLATIRCCSACDGSDNDRNECWKTSDRNELALRLTQCLRVRPSPVINKMPFLSS